MFTMLRTRSIQRLPLKSSQNVRNGAPSSRHRRYALSNPGNSFASAGGSFQGVRETVAPENDVQLAEYGSFKSLSGMTYQLSLCSKPCAFLCICCDLICRDPWPLCKFWRTFAGHCGSATYRKLVSRNERIKFEHVGH